MIIPQKNTRSGLHINSEYACEVTIDGFPLTSANELTASLHSNGAQQLHIQIRLYRPDFKEIPHEIIDNLKIYDEGYQPVRELSVADGDPPILKEHGWAFSNTRSNTFTQSKYGEQSTAAKHHEFDRPYREIYLHCFFDDQASEGIFYIGLQEDIIFKTLKIRVRPEHLKNPSRILVRPKRISGFNYLTSAQSTPPFKYAHNPSTTEYFILYLPNGFATVEISGVDDEPHSNVAPPRNSIVKTMTDPAQAQFFSITGVVTSSNQKEILLDERLASFFPPTLIDRRFYGTLEINTIVISVHRIFLPTPLPINAELHHLLKNTFPKPLIITFRNHEGNLTEATIQFTETNSHYPFSELEISKK